MYSTILLTPRSIGSRRLCPSTPRRSRAGSAVAGNRAPALPQVSSHPGHGHKSPAARPFVHHPKSVECVQRARRPADRHRGGLGGGSLRRRRLHRELLHRADGLDAERQRRATGPLALSQVCGESRQLRLDDRRCALSVRRARGARLFAGAIEGGDCASLLAWR